MNATLNLSESLKSRSLTQNQLMMKKTQNREFEHLSEIIEFS